MNEIYNFKLTESKWQLKWEQDKTYYVNENSNKPKFYCLSMLPYPSGKLHMGHVRNYTIGDVFARFYQKNGYNVLHPFGWDSFGLPAENAALQTAKPPSDWTHENINYMRHQLKSLGLAVDWSREITTCSPDYYKHQQLIFIKLYNKGLIYKKNGIVNWDPIDNTVLANEQVIDGRGWRSGALVEKKQIPMYYFKITAYAEELLQDLDNLPNWPEQVKLMQKNWIGKSIGMEICFPFEKDKDGIVVFSTRPDTIMGVTFLAISIDHPLSLTLMKTDLNIAQYIKECAKGGISEEELATQEKTGIFTGIYVLNPLDNTKIPVWITNYVLSSYGTGAVMGVPAHDQRDFEFKEKYNLNIKYVIKSDKDIDCSSDKGILVNSGILDNLNYDQAFDKIEEFLHKKKLGKKKVNYRIRDWGISRQRYWGCPIPIIHCDNCGDSVDNNLPVILPDNLLPNGITSPLKGHKEFYQINCPKCKQIATRETDTMDTFVDSSWYYARYTSYDNANEIIDKRADYWLPVDQYIGGEEHSILHLLYARFFHKCLRDIGIVSSNEPFTSLLTQGMVLAETFYNEDSITGKKNWINPKDVTTITDDNGKVIKAVDSNNNPVFIGLKEKMSKSKNNGVDPNTIINQYGADTVRLFMLFASPPESSLEWSDKGIEGAYRFIRKLWRLVYEHSQQNILSYTPNDQPNESLDKLKLLLNKTIMKVTTDIQIRKQFNTAIASIMELLNSYTKIESQSKLNYHFSQEFFKTIIILLSPITPHICEELWLTLSPDTRLYDQPWPKYQNLDYLDDKIELIIQINGKLRGKIDIDKSMNKEKIESMALEHENIKKYIVNGVKKIIHVPNKIINIVI